MNKKALIISLSIFFIMLGCIIGGIVLIVINKNFNGFNMNYKTSKEILLEKEYELDFDNLNIDTNMSDIQLKTTDSDKLKVVVYSNKKDVKVQLDKNLDIKSTSIKKCKFFCVNAIIPKIVVYIPNDFEKPINIKNKYGNIKIKSVSSDLNVDEQFGNIEINSIKEATISNEYGDININKAKSVKINESAGDIRINKVEKAKIKNDFGNIKIDVVTDSFNINVSCGDIKINQVNIKQNSKIKTDYGDVKIIKINDIYVKAKSEAGNVIIEKNDKDSDIVLEIESNLGNIKVDK